MSVELQDEKFIRHLHGNSTFGQLLDIQFVESIEGYAEVLLQLDPNKHWNTNDMVHGGVYASLLDTVSGLSVRTKLQVDKSLSTINISINYTKAITDGNLIAKSKIVTFGKQIATVKVEIFNENTELIANSISTFVIITKRGNTDA